MFIRSCKNPPIPRDEADGRADRQLGKQKQQPEKGEMASEGSEGSCSRNGGMMIIFETPNHALEK